MNKVDYEKMIDEKLATAKEEMMKRFKEEEKEAEFEAERRKVIKELKKYAEPENKEWDMENIHWTYRYDFSTKEVCCDWLRLVKYNGIYFENLERAEKALEAVGEDRVKKYYLRVED